MEWLRGRGYDVVVGECMDGTGLTSAPAEARATELDPDAGRSRHRLRGAALGRETAIDLVDLLDWDTLASAEPTWLVGYSDLSTVLVPITTRLGWATIHGDNLADTPYVVPDGLLHWLDLAGGPGTVRAARLRPGGRLGALRDRPDGHAVDAPSARARGRCSVAARSTSPGG